MFDDDDTHDFGDQIDRANSMAELLALVAAINAMEDPEDGITLDRLRDWLERLTARLKELGRVVGASSVTLTVGPQINASVTYGLMPGGLS
jgi:hypothetical protein